MKTKKTEIKISDNIDDFQLKKLDKRKKLIVHVFDDCGKDRDQLTQEEFFQTGRHYKCSCIYLTHRFHEPVLKSIRAYSTCFILFEHSKKVSEQIVRDINIGMDKNEFYRLAREAWANSRERNYLFINPELEGDRVLISPFKND